MQNEIKAPQKLLNEKGFLANPGWARQFHFEYNPENMTAPRSAAKEWDYYAIGNDEVVVALTLNDFGILGMTSISLLKPKENFDITKGSRVMGACLDQPKDDKGCCYIRTDDTEITFIRKGNKHYLKADMTNFDDQGNDIHVDITLDLPETDRMVIATPFDEGPQYFYLNEKINCMPASGTVTLGDFTYTFDPAKDMGVLDLGRGYWPAHNTWFWGSASGKLNGKPLGWNIGYGFGNLSNATENMIIYDGVAHKFDRIDFGIPEEGYLARPWHVVSNDGRFDMQFVPLMDRMSPSDRKKPGSDQHQVFGYYTGKCVLDDGTVLEVRDFFGFAEEVHNNWDFGINPRNRAVKLGGDVTALGLESLDQIYELDCKSVLIVTSGPFAVQSGQMTMLTSRLDRMGAKYAIFDGIEPNPEFSSILAGAKVALELQPDWIFGIGGGSALDASKAIWAVYENPEIDELPKLREPGAVARLREKAHLLVVPTTAGTGSEVTNAIVISDSANNLKASINDRRLMPDVALLCPVMTSSMPASLSANTGLDALTHAIEAYVSRLANDFTDAMAEKSCQMIMEYLSKAVKEPNNQDYRAKMQNASTMAGMAFATVNLGVAHSIAHAFGGVFHVPHGLANAITLPVSIAYNVASPVAAAKYERLEKLCGVEDLRTAIEVLRAQLNVPATMKEVVRDDEKYEQMSDALVAHALADLCSMTNPVPLDAASMKKLMDIAYYGE